MEGGDEGKGGEGRGGEERRRDRQTDRQNEKTHRTGEGVYVVKRV